MIDQRYSFDKAFLIYTAWYCNDGPEIDRFIEWLEKQERNSQYGLDHVHIGPKEKEDFEEIDLLLSCLILMFGDYGTSPRYGWIEQVDNALNWLRYVRMYWQGDDE